VSKTAIEFEGISCHDCALGRASGAGRSQLCPFIIRHYKRGEVICLAGDPAGYVWFVKQGVVGLDRSRDERDELDKLDGLRLPGSYIGLECMVDQVYLRTARAVSSVTLCGATRDGFYAWLRQDDERIATIMRAVLEDPLVAFTAEALASRQSGPADA
jgi:CRP-like cAMP-binding protein